MVDKVLCGDMREVLRPLKDGSVDMCVTSPPYWGQRAYAGETEAVWGGDADCEHVWGEEQLGGEGYADGSRIRWQSVGGRAGMPEGGFKKQTARGRFCQRCGAWYGELGREPTVELYIEHMVECFREVWRVLSPYGTLWLNLGGCYAGSGGAGGDYNIGGLREGQPKYGPKRPKGYKPLDYIPVPHLVAMALQREGWYWRKTIVWHKPAPMPESINTWRWERCRVKREDLREPTPGKVNLDRGDGGDKASGGLGENPYACYEPCPGCPKCEPHGGYRLYYGAWRPTTAHEMVFMFSKQARYYCDQDAVRTGYSDHTTWEAYEDYNQKDAAGTGAEFPGDVKRNIRRQGPNPSGANARSVQSWPTANLGLDHFAAFSVELAAWCIRAGTSARGYCPKCNRPWVRVVEKTPQNLRPHILKEGKARQAADGIVPEKMPPAFARTGVQFEWEISTLGWKATCECGGDMTRPDEWIEGVGFPPYEPRPGIVLDPFGGSGTVGLAAKGLGRNYVLCEISGEYVAMSEARIRKGFTPGRKQRKIAKGVEVEGVGKVTEMRLGL